MRSGLPFGVVVGASETALKKLAYDFFKNDFGHTVEFEVSKPGPFAVRVQLPKEAESYNPALGGEGEAVERLRDPA